METVGKIGKVRFVNDSKATNADAARQAMSSYPKFYWIAGGVAKAGGIKDLADLFPRIAKAYLIGEASLDFGQTLEGKAPVRHCASLEIATAAAYSDALDSGEDSIVLLSPACASFDQFADFEARGEAFRAAVEGLSRIGAKAG
jgi:UDP-N-acetylmuramoylalanine--D-glutamate ligase